MTHSKKLNKLFLFIFNKLIETVPEKAQIADLLV